MTVSPGSRLLALLAGWIGLAALCVLAPALWPAAALAFGLLLLSAGADSLLLLREPAPVLLRRVPERLSVGREAQLELELSNPGATDLDAELLDELPRDLAPSDPHFVGVRVPAGGRVQRQYPVTPSERGERVLGRAAALVASPLGLWRRRVLAPRDPAAVSVYPDASRFLRPEALDAKRLLALLGVRPSPRRGDGSEFESLREYVPGDDTRRLDWRASARRGRLVTRVYQHERSHSVMIALDASRLMGARSAPGSHGPGRSKLDHCIDAALALVYAALGSGDRAGLTVFDREIRGQLASRTRRADLGLFVELLRPVESRLVEADYRALVRGLLGGRLKRSLVVILTDFVEADPEVLIAPLSLLARRHRVLLVAVRDPVLAEEDGAHRQIVLGDLLREREETLARLRLAGLHTLDLAAGEITAPVLNRYLAIRYDRES